MIAQIYMTRGGRDHVRKSTVRVREGSEKYTEKVQCSDLSGLYHCAETVVLR